MEPLEVNNNHSSIVSNELEDSKHNIEESTPNRFISFLKRSKTKIAVGAAAVSVATTLALDPLGETTDKLVEAAPWVGGGVLASEALFIGGAAMMLAGVGDKIGNPLTMKHRVGEIAEKANDSVLFKTGFWTNTVGAVGDFAVISAGVGTQLPPHSWGVMGLTLLDLGVTVGVRKAVLDGIRDNSNTSIVTNTETANDTF